MEESTVAEVKETRSFYYSPRDIGDVLFGEDAARLLIEASSSGHDMTLQSLLSQPQWIKTMLETPHSIDSQYREKQGPNDVRQVSATRRLNLERALTKAAENGHAAVVSTLLTFATQQGIHTADIITRMIINKAIGSGQGAVFKALASADPDVINFPLGHGVLPLWDAARRRQTDVVGALLELGADPLHPVAPSKELYPYSSALLARAARAEGPRLTELLLAHGVPVSNTGALHVAARSSQLETMRVLIEHGADLNEALPKWHNWTPMHFAASKHQVDAVKFLERSGARSDLKDADGKTPAQLQEEPPNPLGY